MKVEIIEATLDHIDRMYPLVRVADINEVFAVAYKSPLEALLMGLHLSETAWTGLVDDEPICMFGVAPSCLLTNTGTPWLLGTDGIEKHAGIFIRHSIKHLNDLFGEWDRLINYVDARNKKAVRWLKWMGFTIYDPQPYGVMNKMFHKFEMIRGL